MQAEEAGDDCGGELGGEVEERGPAAGLGVDAEGAQALAEPGRGDGPPGQVAGEQPGGGGLGSDAAVTAAAVDELEGGGGERAGNGNIVAAEPDEYLAVVAGDLAGGNDGDAGERLPVKEQQASGDPVGEVERVVVQ